MPRPRSAEAHCKVVEAAAQMFADQGIDSTSMDAIASASGVSKATIYKHWPDKDQLVLEVLSYLHGMDEEWPTFNSGDLRADLIAQLSYQPGQDRAEIRERILPHLIAYSARNRVFGTAWRSQVMERQRAALRGLLERGIQQRELVRTLDIETAYALLLGPMIYRHIFVNCSERDASRDLATKVVSAFLRAFSAELEFSGGGARRGRR